MIRRVCLRRLRAPDVRVLSPNGRVGDHELLPNHHPHPIAKIIKTVARNQARSMQADEVEVQVLRHMDEPCILAGMFPIKLVMAAIWESCGRVCGGRWTLRHTLAAGPRRRRCGVCRPIVDIGRFGHKRKLHRLLRRHQRHSDVADYQCACCFLRQLARSQLGMVLGGLWDVRVVFRFHLGAAVHQTNRKGQS